MTHTKNDESQHILDASSSRLFTVLSASSSLVSTNLFLETSQHTTHSVYSST